MSAIQIDGRFGEGGGQILRTSLSLSMLTGEPFRIEGIRGGRRKPGLLRQHLTAVRAAAEISGAEVSGNELGSTEISFAPGPVRAGDYRFVIGTAGSAALVLQTVLPPLMVAAGASRLTLEGGTHNPSAPPYPFLERAFVPLVERMGPRVGLTLERHGFYPAGGGQILAMVEPVAALTPVVLGERARIESRRILGILANLPFHIAQRETACAAERLGWDGEGVQRWEQAKNSAGPGNALCVEAGTAEATVVFTEFGELGVPAETVANRAVKQMRRFLASKAAVCEHLADQLLLPMAMAGGGSFTAVELNLHARTNMAVIGQFLPGVRFKVESGEGFERVTVE